MENEIVIKDLIKRFGDLYARSLPKIVCKMLQMVLNQDRNDWAARKRFLIAQIFEQWINKISSKSEKSFA